MKFVAVNPAPLAGRSLGIQFGTTLNKIGSSGSGRFKSTDPSSRLLKSGIPQMKQPNSMLLRLIWWGQLCML